MSKFSTPQEFRLFFGTEKFGFRLLDKKIFFFKELALLDTHGAVNDMR
jgi:hypothetical protein